MKQPSEIGEWIAKPHPTLFLGTEKDKRKFFHSLTYSKKASFSLRWKRNISVSLDIFMNADSYERQHKIEKSLSMNAVKHMG